MATFVLNDEEKVNSYGFKIPNAGIDLKRFKANPVILDQHYNSTWAVLGKWTNIRIDGSKLLADAEFDKDDEAAEKISGKVERGYIKGASMGVSFDREAMQQNPKNEYELTKCELYEASIVAIPSNANSLRLYAGNGELIPETEIQLSLSNLQGITPEKNKKDDMSKVLLTALAIAALGLENAENEIDVNAKIVDMQKQLTAKDTALKTLQKQVDDSNNAKVETLVNDAIAQGKLSASSKDEFTEMAKTNFSLAEKVISGLSAKQTLGDKAEAPKGGTEVKSDEDFQKLSHSEQLAWKEANPDAYRKLFA